MTPRPLLLAALLAAPSAALAVEDIAPPKRCDAVWLEATGKILAANKVVSDERVTVVANEIKLVPDSKKTCDAATWAMLRTGSPLEWRNPAVKALWADGVKAAPQTAFLLGTNDFLAVSDARAAKLIAAADAVIDAGVALGLAEATPGEKTLAELVGGASGGPVGASKPRVVKVKEDGSGTAIVAPDQLGANFRVLLNDAGGAKTAGAGVLEFRRQVLQLGEKLKAWSASEALMTKRGLKGVKDFSAGLPADFTPTESKDENLVDVTKFNAGLAKLVGDGAAGLDDKTSRPAAAVERLDLGLRNLLIVRAAEAEKLFQAAGKRLGNKTIAQLESAARSNARLTDAKIDQNTIAGASLSALAGRKDYADLESMYTAALKRDGVTDPSKATGATKELGDRLDAMRKSAGSTSIVSDDKGKHIVFTDVDNVRRTFDVPADVESNEKTRAYYAGQVANLIMSDSKRDGKLEGLAQALAGTVQPGVPADARTSLTVDPIPAPVNGAASPWSAAMKSKDAGCGSPSDIGKSEIDRIAERKAERVADAASDNSKLRTRLQNELNASDKKHDEECKAKLANPPNPDMTPAAIQAQCVKDKDAARAAIWAKPEYANVKSNALETTTRDEGMASARKEVRDLFDAGIAETINKLQAAYVKKGDKHRLDLERATGYKDAAFSADRVALFFDVVWRDKNNPVPETQWKKAHANSAELFDACRKKFGWNDDPKADLKAMHLENPRMDREEDVEGSVGVNEDCGVRAELVTFFRSFRGTMGTQDPTDAGTLTTPGGTDVDAELERRAKKPAPKK